MYKIAIFLLYAAAAAVLYEFNSALFFLINHNLPEFLINENLFITTIADGFFILLFLLFSQKIFKRTTSAGIVSFIIVALLVQIIKEIIGAPRPVKVFGDQSVFLYGIYLTQNSFPSGHTAAAFFLARVMTWKRKSWLIKLFWILFALNAGISRIVVGVHFPIDVFAGAIIGFYGTHLLLKTRILDKPFIVRFFLRIGPIAGTLLSIIYLFFYKERIPEFEFLTIPLVTVTMFYFLREFIHSKRSFSAINQNHKISHPAQIKKMRRFSLLSFIRDLSIFIVMLIRPFKKAIAIGILFLLITFSMELSYIFHLAKYQFYVLTHMESITTLLEQTENSEKTKKLKTIYQSVRFAKSLYRLKDSNSFNYYVHFHRNKIGDLLTITPPFSLKPVNFNMPIAGSFSYIGFTDERIRDRYINYYRRKHYDINISTIAAYSTLDYFPIPLLNTYLNDEQSWILELIFHELTHEKIFFKNDVYSSEQLAVFMQKQMLQDFYRLHPELKENVAAKKNRISRNDLFKRIQSLRIELETIFYSRNNSFSKYIQKHFAYHRFYLDLLNMYKKASIDTDKIISFEKLNNAFLVQFKRYQHSAGLFQQFYLSCKNNKNQSINKKIQFIELQKTYDCFFNKLEQLKKCPSAARRASIEAGMLSDEHKKTCRY